MLFANTISTFIAQAFDAADLTGNCGKAVRRLIESTFVGQTATFTVASDSADLLVFAAEAALMEQACEMAQSAAEMTAHPDMTVRRVVVDTAERAITVQVALAQAIPEGVKARKQMLCSVAFVLRRVHTMAELRQVGTAEDILMAAFSDVEPSAGKLSDYLAQFNRLAAGDFSELGSIPLVLLALAEPVTPGLAEELKRLDEEYNRTVGTAFAAGSGDTLDAKRLFASVL